MHTLESAIVFPIVFIVVCGMVIAYFGVTATAYFDQEDGAAFLLSALKNSRLRGYETRVELAEVARLTGTDLCYVGRRSEFRIFKPSRILYGILFGR